MSMCCLCDMCKHRIERRKWDWSLDHVCAVSKRTNWVVIDTDWVVIDWGRDNPREICVHFEPRGDAE